MVLVFIENIGQAVGKVGRGPCGPVLAGGCRREGRENFRARRDSLELGPGGYSGLEEA